MKSALLTLTTAAGVAALAWGCSSATTGPGGQMGPVSSNGGTGGTGVAGGANNNNNTAGGGAGMNTAGGAGPVAGGAGPVAGGAGGMGPGPEGGAGPSTAGMDAGGMNAGGMNTAGMGTGGQGVGGVEPGDTPPLRPLNVTAEPDSYCEDFEGRTYCVDTTAPTMMGKLIIDLGVNGANPYNFALRRGFHVASSQFANCQLTYDDLEHNGNCRLNRLDGLPHGDQNDTSPSESILGRLAVGLAAAHDAYPEQDWGYFLNADGSVRLSDVGFTGYSHGAQSAARFGVAYRLYRAVSRSGPRDNECGDGQAAGDFNPADPPYDTTCERVSAWIRDTPATPIERFFGFTGKTDGQYGDIMYTMELMGFLGDPVNISTATAPYGGSHRFYADTGHSGFDDFTDALNIAFGVPPENAAHAAGQ